jgi:hypothetical protein
MDQIPLNFFIDQNIQISLKSFILNIVTASILSFVVQNFYLKFSKSLSDKITFSKNFVILAVTTTIVITIVKSSLALSLGLVGALSIVRFRAAIKDPEELVYLFLIIAVGLGCGAGQIYITVIGTLFSLFIMFIYFSLQKKKFLDDNKSIHLGITIPNKLKEQDIELIIKELKKITLSAQFISMSRDEKETVLNIELRPKNLIVLNKMFGLIEKKYPKSKFVIAQKSEISL